MTAQLCRALRGAWDINDHWLGAPLTRVVSTTRYMHFYPAHYDYPTFTLVFDEDVPADTMRLIADAYMRALNAARMPE